MKEDILRKILVIGSIVILLGVGVHPVIAEESIGQENCSEKNWQDEKAYLFQTFIDVVNNPSVEKLLEQSREELKNKIIYDIDGNRIIKKILLEKPGMLFTMLFTKPSISYNYLNKLYNQGIELVNILGEDEVLEIAESINFNNEEFVQDLNLIIKNDEILSKKVLTLEEMNVFKSDAQSWSFPIICTILLFNWLSIAITSLVIQTILIILQFIPIINEIYPQVADILNKIESMFHYFGHSFNCYWT
jgi:hypothetical protein